MSVHDYQVAIRLLKDNGIELLSSVGASEMDVTAIEHRLGVVLPPSYRAMVAEFGNLAFQGIEIYGWTRSGLAADSVPSMIFATESDRKKGLISDRMIIFMVAGYGPTIVLDCAEADAAGEAPVYEIATGGMKHGRDRLADSFGAFFLREVERIVAEVRAEQGAAASGEDMSDTTSKKWMADYWKQRAKDFE